MVIKIATFAAGCFWHVQYVFDKIEGVERTIVGYANSEQSENEIDYHNAESEGYAEAVQVEFDEDIVSYGDLLGYFWKEHNPTSKDSQGADVGHRYRSAIFYSDLEQKEKAKESLKNEQKKYSNKIVTEIVPLEDFVMAEDYHQKYLARRG